MKVIKESGRKEMAESEWKVILQNVDYSPHSFCSCLSFIFSLFLSLSISLYSLFSILYSLFSLLYFINFFILFFIFYFYYHQLISNSANLFLLYLQNWFQSFARFYSFQNQSKSQLLIDFFNHIFLLLLLLLSI